MTIRPRYILFGALFALVLAFPMPSRAATSSRPSCMLGVLTPSGTSFIQGHGVTPILKDQTLILVWLGSDADTAVSQTGATVPLLGYTMMRADQPATYAYTFSSSAGSVTCSTDIEIVRATFDSVSGNSDGEDVELSGTVFGTESVRVTLSRNGTPVSTTDVDARGDRWELALRDDLNDGLYTVVVTNASSQFSQVELARSTFYVGDVPATTLSASPVALLFGGTARAGGSVPVAYVKLANTGAQAATISGFDLAQNGSAPGSSVIGFTTSDDKGGSLSSVSGSFQNNRTFVPLAATINPGQFRIFTLKAQVAGNAGAYSGTQLKIDVTGVRSAGSVTGTFPMRGTTWTLAY